MVLKEKAAAFAEFASTRRNFRENRAETPRDIMQSSKLTLFTFKTGKRKQADAKFKLVAGKTLVSCMLCTLSLATKWDPRVKAVHKKGSIKTNTHTADSNVRIPLLCA